MSNIDKRALREAAQKATPGRIGDRIDGSGSIKYECRGYDGSLVLRTDHKNMEYGFIGDNANADELFFRLCVPDVVLALLDELEAKDKLNAELMEKQRLIDICQGQGLEHRIAAEKRAEAAEKRIAELETREVKMPKLKMLSDYLSEVTHREREDILLGVKLEFYRELQAAGIRINGEG
ncbi:ead/Ea22-like family protein [Leclercia pneumoniae]|uniref:ead/Ea22-like family protein n=1 Tax=Leclercia pneumoniae TaxID=2815358 RepID=UPI0030D15EE0